MTRRLWLAFLPVALSALLIGTPALAQGDTRPTQMIFTAEYTLSAGEIVPGNLVVVAQQITLEQGSRVEGDVALVGDTIAVNGEVTGELTALGTRITLGNTAHVRSDAVLCAADSITRMPDARVVGAYRPACEDLGAVWNAVVPLAFDPSRWEWGEFSPQTWDWGGLSGFDAAGAGPTAADRLLFSAGLSLVIGAGAALCALFAPFRVRRVSEAALNAPLATFGIGVLSLLIAGAISLVMILSLLLIVTFCLLPLLWLGWAVLALMMLLGWTAIGLPTGAWIMSRLHIRRVSPMVTASLGSMILTFALGLLMLSIWTMPLYLLIGGVVGAWGLGAAILTRLGGQTYPQDIRTRLSAGVHDARAQGV